MLVFLPWLCAVVVAGCNGAAGIDGSRVSRDQSGDAAPGAGGAKPEPSASATAMPSASSVPGACLPALAPCEAEGPSCCTGLVCVSSTSSDYAGCRKPCGAPSDCDTRCCVPYADGKLGFCGAASLCGCAAADGTCGGTRHCCDGLVCTTVDTPGAFACRPSCKTKADCTTGCCLQITGTADSACMPSKWCEPVPK